MADHAMRDFAGDIAFALADVAIAARCFNCVRQRRPQFAELATFDRR
jgi:hypothetical protein